MNNAIELKNVTKIYDDFSLDVSFTVPQGYIMGLIGPNAAGKTTIIKLIMNLIRKHGGSIDVFGLDHLTHEVEIKSRLGFVFDQPDYYKHLSLDRLRNIVAPFYADWDEKRFQNLVMQFKLPLNKPMKKYSRGMIMKSALALALSHNADLIIMDEPTSGLDPVFRREFLDMLGDILQDEKKSILFSTHITSDLERIADYITLIIQGRIVFSKPKDEILQQYALVKGGNEVLEGEGRSFFPAARKKEFGFEALVRDAGLIRKRFGERVHIDRASLDDIMYYHNKYHNF